VVAIHNGVPEILGWVYEDEARRLLETRKVTLCHRKGQARRLLCTDIKPGERISFARAELKHTRYSHNRETPHNPQNCWTLIHLPEHVQRVFMAVLISAGGATLIPEMKRKRTHGPQPALRSDRSGRDDRRPRVGNLGRVPAVVPAKAA
jgi:hypothetical protein